VIGQKIINPIDGLDDVGVVDYRCECKWKLTCSVDVYEGDKYRIFIDDNELSETFLQPVAVCPGCGIALYWLA